MLFMLDLVSENRVQEILEQLHKEGIETKSEADHKLLVDEIDVPRAIEILKRVGI